MKPKFFLLKLLIIFLLLPLLVLATDYPEEYQALSSQEKQRANTIMESEFLYDCCDNTIAACLENQPECSLARRLTAHISRLIEQGKSDGDIRLSLANRAQTMLGTSRSADINVEGYPVVGDPQAPVTIIVYSCLRCPFCSRLIPEMFDCIESGCMQGQAKMIFKPFPVRSHDYSVEGGKAFLAAMEQDKGFEYLLKAYSHFDSFSGEEDYFDYARELGLNMAAFQQDYNDPTRQETLVDCKREGLYVGVEATPALFINGRPYRSELNMTMIRDIVEEEIERVQ